MAISFPYPDPPAGRPLVHPVFLPFAGCPFRCVFCAQTRQTGTKEHPISHAIRQLEKELAALARRHAAPRELAFFGGTFTNLPQGQQLALIKAAAHYRTAGLVTKIRCSTRPDAIDMPLLTRLKDAGLDMVELGIQSFSDTALTAARRGYSGDCARDACRMVIRAGLRLGIQLMPGMPGGGAEEFAADMEHTVALTPEILRLYPCLVLEGTELAEQWKRGAFMPWTLDQTLAHLASAVVLAWREGITVSRIGLAPEESLTAAVLAGPKHPALGGRVKARALASVIAAERARLPGAPRLLRLPRRARGMFWGHKKELAAWYASIGVTPDKLRWWDNNCCELS